MTNIEYTPGTESKVETFEANGTFEKTDGYCTDVFFNQALKWVEAKSGQQPFFCYIAYNTPHSPMQVPDKYYSQYKNLELKSVYHGKEKEDIEFTRTALAMCQNLDDNIVLNSIFESL